MTKEQAREWAKTNAGKKFSFKGDAGVQAQEVVVIGTYVHGDALVTVQLSKGDGWKLSGLGDTIEWTAPQLTDGSKTYRHVSTNDLTAIPEVKTAEEFAKANVGKTLTFSGKHAVDRGRVVGYDDRYVLIERADGQGWPMAAWTKLTMLEPAKADKSIYWWVRHDEAQPEPAPEKKSPAAEEFAKANAGKLMIFKDGSKRVRGTVSGYDSEDYVLIEREDGDGWTLRGLDYITMVVPRKAGKVYWWVKQDDAEPVAETIASEMKKVGEAETFARAHLGERWLGKWAGTEYTGMVVGYNDSYEHVGKRADAIILDLGGDNGMYGWSADVVKKGTWLIGPVEGRRYWHLLPDDMVGVVIEEKKIEAAPEECRGCEVTAEVKAAAFEPGDVVYLKSGGPAMTVDGRADEDGEYLCRWFPMDRWNGETSTDYFPAATLTKTPTRVEQ